MRWIADIGVRRTVVGLLALTACAAPPPPSPSLVPPSDDPTPTPEVTTAATATPTASEPGGAGIDLPIAGRPLDAAAVLEAMRATTRPGGVPDELETVEAAAAIAQAIWTVDGMPWDTASIGGFCGTATCTLDVAGSRDDRAGEDLWTLEVDRGTGSLELLVADVRSLPPALVDELDRLARLLVEEVDGDSLLLVNARWLPPPAEGGRFVLSYRSGGEEGSCAREITVNATRGEVVDDHASGC